MVPFGQEVRLVKKSYTKRIWVEGDQFQLSPEKVEGAIALGPALDVNPSVEKDELALHIDDISGIPDYDLATNLCEYFRLTTMEAQRILSQIKKAVNNRAETARQICSVVVLLRGINVGGHKTFRPTIIAEQLKQFRCRQYRCSRHLCDTKTRHPEVAPCRARTKAPFCHNYPLTFRIVEDGYSESSPGRIDSYMDFTAVT